jgi:hypothetical protein
MPSTTIIAQPQVLMPAYNPIKYIIDNTNKNEPGFRYIFSIFPAGSNTLIAQYKTLPVYGTGYGEQDISKLMQSLVTWSYAIGPVNESWYQYKIRLGYEFTSNIIYTNSLVESGGGDVEIQYTAHGFVLGDQISITQAAGGIAANPTVEGLHTVIYASANLFVINARWDTVTDDTINGTVTYADLRKTQVLDDEIIEDQEVFNGAYSLGIYAQGSFPSAEYLGTLDPSYALTSLTNPNTTATAASIATGQLYFLMVRTYSGETYDVTYYDWNDNALTGTTTASGTTDGLYNFFVTTDVPFETPITQNFRIEIKGDSAVFNYYFKYDNRCAINEDYLYYLDRMGSWQSFAFQLKTYEKGQITREMYNQQVDGQVVDGEWVYSSTAIGNRTLNTNVSNTLELNTNWMDQYDADRFQELLTSPQVFYFDGTENRACTIDATSFENFRQRNKNLIKQSVTIKLALNTPING